MAKVRRLFHKKWRWQRVTKLMARDGQNCMICRCSLSRKIKSPHHNQYITFDHIVPRSHGGTNQLHNLRLAHRLCNMRRGNDPLLDEHEDKALSHEGLEQDAGLVNAPSESEEHQLRLNDVGDAGVEPARDEGL